ncbi:hypothetical protein DCS_04001 [Drechmeria coniospora]|uniref:AB hydrolase-1 domain-containing protein n=1 Tax=Drechmeria coniospora TaxID=98403 RepID=A0A151GIS7_DRECN|nr:hypothetical protein DCS_04001 [Drechmeria coniospora]KYK56994.1 hypothetical protein DCS_04001 [Drechmeria coniospora]ODA78268.1 hypothetical protein RJ55_05649 [Drechmeria coniospora]
MEWREPNGQLPRRFLAPASTSGSVSSRGEVGHRSADVGTFDGERRLSFETPCRLPIMSGGHLQVVAFKAENPENETASVRTHFFVGGGYVDDGRGRHLLRGQMYVEKLLPVRGVTQKTPVVLIHGKGMTGTNFLDKPDGGRGWASDFVSRGYEVYMVDQVFRGRSAWQPGGSGSALPVAFPAELVQDRFTATGIRKLWPQAGKHTQWPGTGLMGDPVFDQFYASHVQYLESPAYTEAAMKEAGAALLDAIAKPALLLGHSQAGQIALLLADARPNLVKGLILVEPAGPPFRDVIFSTLPARAYGLTDAPLTYHPPVNDPTTDLVRETWPAPDEEHVDCVIQAERPAPRILSRLADKPILVVTSESGYHSQYDYCTVRYLLQAGCSKTEHLELGSVGIHGNGHMMFMEKNSHEIFNLLERWIEKM